MAFPDETRPYGSARLPDSDDVLAKWMALTGDEHRLISTANMHLPGRQLDPARVKRDLWRLTQWERARMRDSARSERPPRSTPPADPRRADARRRTGRPAEGERYSSRAAMSTAAPLTSSTVAEPSPRAPSAPPLAPT